MFDYNPKWNYEPKEEQNVSFKKTSFVQLETFIFLKVTYHKVLVL